MKKGFAKIFVGVVCVFMLAGVFYPVASASYEEFVPFNRLPVECEQD